MSHAVKPRCAECLMALEPSTKACAHCGTARGVLGKSFKSEPDPNVREQMWNAAITSRIEKADTEPEPSQAEQAWAAVRARAVSAPAFIGKAATEPVPAPVADPWSAVVTSITQPTRDQAGA